MDSPEPTQASAKPVGLILTSDEQREVELAIKPLARLAWWIRFVIWAGTILFGLGFFLVIAAWAGQQASLWRVVIAIACAAAAIGLPAWALLVWKGTAQIPFVEIPQPELPAAVKQLLAGVHRGAVRVLYAPDARPSRNYKVLPLAEARGPFMALLLSDEPDTVSLAMWSMFGGYRYTVLFDAEQSDSPQGAGDVASVRITPPPVGAPRTKRRAPPDPIFFWSRPRFERLVHLADEQGLTPDHCRYLLEANRICLEAGKSIAAVELDRYVMTDLQKALGKQWEVTWGTKALRRDYDTIWSVLGPLAAAMEQESPEIPRNLVVSVNVV